MSVFTVPAFPKLAASVRSLVPRCANPACKSVSFLHGFIARSTPGARIEENWYCSPNCFETAINEHLRRLITGAGAGAGQHRSRMSLGLTLLARGTISHEQFRSAAREQRNSGRKLEEILVEKGFATEEQITAAVASQWGAPIFPLGSRYYDMQVRIPYPLLEIYSLLPVHFGAKANKLLIGFVHAIEHRLLSAIEHVLGCTTAPCFITATDYQRRLPMLAAEQPVEAVFERPSPIPDIAKIVRNYAIQTGADEARFGHCLDYLWARLQGSRREVDLLFRLSAAC